MSRAALREHRMKKHMGIKRCYVRWKYFILMRRGRPYIILHILTFHLLFEFRNVPLPFPVGKNCIFT